MTFEENPLVLVVFIVATVEGWSLTKRIVRSILGRRRKVADGRR